MEINFYTVLVVFVLISSVNSFFADERDKRALTEDDDDTDNAWRQILSDVSRQNYEQDHPEELSGTTGHENVFRGQFSVVERWPYDKFPIGEVGGVAVDSKGLLHILHRAKRTWGLYSFSENNEYIEHNKEKIHDPTVLVVNTSDGSIIKHWGGNLFVLPHGLEIDSKDNLYITDVGLHQVFKFEPGMREPSLTLGLPFEPANGNNDDAKFCKPTDVAVAENGDFFVADGYCNNRILKYNSEGKLIAKFGMDDTNIPHGLALVEEMDYLCVADREHMRVLCYRAGIKKPNVTGQPMAQFINHTIGRIYGITYSPVDGLLYGVTGKTGALKSQGFTLDVKNSQAYDTNLVAEWSPDDSGFTSPHDIAVSKDGEFVFVGEIEPNLVWKMEKED